MQKIILNVPQDLHEALRARKEETGTPTSVFIRRLIAQALQGPAPVEYRDNDVAANLRRAGCIEARDIINLLRQPGGPYQHCDEETVIRVAKTPAPPPRPLPIDEPSHADHAQRAVAAAKVLISVRKPEAD